MAENEITTWIREKVTAEVVIAFVLGVFLGLVVLGWRVWPVQWTNTDPADLKPSQKECYVQMIADSYALTGNSDVALARLEALKRPGEEDADLASMLDALIKARLEAGKADEAIRLQELSSAAILPTPTAPKATPAAPVGAAGRPVLRVVGIAFFLLLLGAGVVLLLMQLQKREAIRRRRPLPAEQPFAKAAQAEREGIAPASPESSLGQFATTYSLGEEGYDLSYSIEAPTGEFLGECGISALEEVVVGEPGQVSAFEVWLFDKEDVRTETKVLMSERAFGDEALRDKLANKGALVQAEQGKVVTLETANLRLDAAIDELDYEGVSNAVFARLTTTLEILRR
jgi:hypothetical protein